jgi:hypothetical protein
MTTMPITSVEVLLPSGIKLRGVPDVENHRILIFGISTANLSIYTREEALGIQDILNTLYPPEIRK